MNVTNKYCYFFEEEEFKETGRDGFRRRVITGENSQLWFWRIRGGSTGSIMHNHVENEQLGIILRGKLDFRIGDKESAERVVLGEGEVFDRLFLGILLRLGPLGFTCPCPLGLNCLPTRANHPGDKCQGHRRPRHYLHSVPAHELVEPIGTTGWMRLNGFAR